MPLGHRSARRRGMITGAAIASSRSKRREAAVQVNAQQTANAPSSPGNQASTDDAIKFLKELAELRDNGILTEEEFVAKKKQVLGL